MQTDSTHGSHNVRTVSFLLVDVRASVLVKYSLHRDRNNKPPGPSSETSLDVNACRRHCVVSSKLQSDFFKRTLCKAVCPRRLSQSPSGQAGCSTACTLIKEEDSNGCSASRVAVATVTRPHRRENGRLAASVTSKRSASWPNQRARAGRNNSAERSSPKTHKLWRQNPTVFAVNHNCFHD